MESKYVLPEAGSDRNGKGSAVSVEKNADDFNIANRSAIKDNQVRRILNRINMILHERRIDPAAEFELAALAKAAPRVATMGSAGNFELLESAVSAIDSAEPNILFSQEIRQHISRSITNNKSEVPLWSIYGGLFSVGLLSIVLGFSVYFVSITLLTLVPNPAAMFWLIVSSFLGASIQLTARIGKSGIGKLSDLSPYFTGFSGPFIGVSSALFAYSLFKAGVIQIGGLSFSGESEIYSTILLGFTCGFVTCGLVERETRAPGASEEPNSSLNAELDRPNPFHMALEHRIAIATPLGASAGKSDVIQGVNYPPGVEAINRPSNYEPPTPPHPRG